MHADYLNVTVPESDAYSVESDLLGIISAVGATAVCAGLFKLPTGGSFKVEEKRGFSLFSASGDALGALRGASLFGDYLSVFSSYAHNVSLLHVAHDIQGDAPRAIKSLIRRSRAPEGLRLTRKRLNPETQVRSLISMGRDGRDTGTVYLGTRKAETRAKVYDKAHERWQNAKVEIPPTVRYELEVTGKAGASLKDAYSPDAVFWHFMSDILPPPDNCPEWVPGALGFQVAPGVPSLPAETLRRLLESSPFLEQCFGLSDQIGRHGYEYLLRLLNERYKARTINLGGADSESVSR